MRQVPLLGLTPIPGVAVARPDVLAQVGRALAAAAQALRGIAGGMSATVSGLSGVWRGGGAGAFGASSATQVSHVRSAADVMDSLATVVAAGARELDAACRAASAALDRGRQLDAEARLLNARTAAQHALLPQDPDSLLVDTGEAERLQAEMERARQALLVAEQAARRAWGTLSAGCDVIAYATPAVRKRLASADWDPAASVRLVATHPLPNGSTTAMDQLGLPKGGVLRGPDGRDYDLQVQTAFGDDGRLVVSSQETPQTVQGWHPLATRYGTTEFGPKAETWQKWAVAFGGAAGMAVPTGARFAPEQLDRLRMLPGGGAYVPAGDNPPEELTVDRSDYRRPGRETEYWTAPLSGLAGGRRAAVPDAIGLAAGALSGVALSRTLDDQRAAAYRVVFEENASGQRRARLQLFRVLAQPGGPSVTVTSGGYVDRSGKLAGTPVTGEDRNRPTVMRPAGR